MTEYRAQFPSTFASVGRARRAIVAFVGQWFAGDDLTDIECAVGEALANCAEHGHRPGAVIDVTVSCRDGALLIDIKDSGCGFERWDATDYLRPLSSSPRGYGMYIMRMLMDGIEYSERGTRLRLKKRLPQRASGESHDGEISA